MKTSIMNTKSILLTLGVIILFTLGGYWLGTQTTNNSASTTQTAEEMQDTSKSDTKEQGDREILYWQAPMNPNEIYDEPGESKMGMELVPVYADEATSSEGMIKINPVVVQNMNVRTAEARQKDLSATVRTVGKIEHNEQKLYTVNTKISGWVENLFVDYTGEMVRRGQPLFSIYSPELVTTQREYLLALKTRDKVGTSSFKTIRNGGNSLLDATRQRLEYWDIPQSAIEHLEKTGEVKKAITLNAPADGMVLHKNAVEGEYIKSGTSAYQIADLSSVWVQASVYDYEVPWIQEGQSAEMELSYQPGKTYQGTVDYVYPSLDQESRTVQVRLEFNNPDLALKPGMYTSVRIQTRSLKDVTVIPNEAIIRTGERNVIFIAQGDGAFEPREVTLGREGGEHNNEIEILSGIEPGEKVVTSAQFLFDSESRLQEAIQKMLKQKDTTEETEMEDMEMDHDTGSSADSVDHSNMQM
jgi:Cu(I)/Ag(I) efflux system membrane fusion protein/cobalt-zinc-cadmium efflux system membrane fusion protein